MVDVDVQGHRDSSKVSSSFCCSACGEGFTSRTQLFRHLEAEGHFESGSESEVAPKERFEARLDDRAFDAYYRLQQICSKEEWSVAYEMFKKPLPLTLRINASSCLATFTRARLAARSPYITPAPYPFSSQSFESVGAVVVTGSCEDAQAQRQLSSLLRALQEAGGAHRQELASLLPPLLLDVEPHHRVLDLCAAPGSKSLQMLDKMHSDKFCTIPGGLLVMNDVNRERAVTIAQRSRRQPRSPMLLVSVDASKFPSLVAHVPGRWGARKVCFDRILTDVPCSGDGTLRKSRKLWGKWSACEGLSLHYKQLSILKRGLQLLRPGGRLAYSTCSLNPIECEAVVAAALSASGPHFRLQKPSSDFSRAEGVSVWSVPHPKFGQISFQDVEDAAGKDAPSLERVSYLSWDDVPLALRHKSPGNGVSLCPTMFPPRDPMVRDMLQLCVRVLPTRSEHCGGFFVAVIERLPKALTTSDHDEIDSEGDGDLDADDGGAAESSDTTEKAKLCERNKDHKACRESTDPLQAPSSEVVAKPKWRRQPPKPLFDNAPEALLRLAEEFWGFSSDPIKAAELGVLPFPRHLTRLTPQGHLIVVSPSLAELVIHDRRRLPIVEGGLCLFMRERKVGLDTGWEELSASWRPFPEAAPLLGLWAARRVVQVGVEAIRELIACGLGALSAERLEALREVGHIEGWPPGGLPSGGCIVRMRIENSGVDSSEFPPLFLPAMVGQSGVLKVDISERYCGALRRLVEPM